MRPASSIFAAKFDFSFSPILPKADFISGCSHYLTPKIDISYECIVNWKELLHDSVDYFAINKNAFDEIKLLAKEFINIDIETEVMDGDIYDSDSILIVRRIAYIGNKRAQLSKTLKYISSQLNNHNLILLAEDFTYISNLWAAVLGMVIKMIITYDIRIRERISDKILQIAEIERKQYIKILKLLNDGEIESTLKFSESYKCKINKYYYICMKENLNNIGFGYSLDITCKAAFSQGTRFLYDTKHRHGENINCMGMRFQLSTNKENTPDNIVCKEQNLIMTEKVFNPKCIMILGCAEYGSFKENLVLFFEDNKSHEVPFELTNWSEGIGRFRDLVAYECYIAERDGEFTQKLPFKARLFAKTYPIKMNGQLTNIKLPYCPNMHIFAITIGA